MSPPSGLYALSALIFLLACHPAARASDDGWRDPRHFSWVAQPSESTADGAATWVMWAGFAVGSLALGLGSVIGLRQWNQWHDASAAKKERAGNVMAEDPSMVEFLRALHQGLPNGTGANASVKFGLATAGAEPGIEGGAGPALEVRRANLTQSSKDLVVMWAGFQTPSRVPGTAECSKILHDLIENVERIKEGSGVAELRPVLLLASALQGLLKQLSTKASNITPSALCTAAAAVDLIELLCNRSLRPDLVTEPPIRLMIVDDEPISRGVLSSALRKTFNEPDLAQDGKAALFLAEQRPYDLILLDVEMPGLDGFEVCTKIHDTAQNFATPVVFVTSHSDFDSRAKSALAGAHDLMGKPFLAFEITVKALTLVLKARLGDLEKPSSARPALDTSAMAAASATAPESASRPQPAASSIEPIEPANNIQTPTKTQGSAQSASSSNAAPTRADKTQPIGEAEQPAQLQPSSAEFAQAFFKGAPGHLQTLRECLISARDTAQPTDRADLLGELFIGVHSIGAEAGRAQLGAAFRVASALEAMLKKLMDRPAFCTPSAFDTAAAAIDSIDQLCQTGKDLDLAGTPVRLLVVDDDPVARRAFSGALQLAIGRPDSADCGEAALDLAKDKAYDLIFLDVLMPGMGGFAVCAKLHELPLNCRTPVVFVTSQDDTDSRAKAKASGGCGFIPKPVLPCEILLLALTSIVRGRLERRSGEPWESPVPVPARETVLAG